jgi:hypothetical protein
MAGACAHTTGTGDVDTTVSGAPPSTSAPNAGLSSCTWNGVSRFTYEVAEMPAQGVPTRPIREPGARPRFSATVSTAMCTGSEDVLGRTRRARRSAAGDCMVKNRTRRSMFSIRTQMYGKTGLVSWAMVVVARRLLGFHATHYIFPAAHIIGQLLAGIFGQGTFSNLGWVATLALHIFFCVPKYVRAC